MRAHEVNEELEGQRPPWCSEHGRWDCDHIDHDPKCQHGNLIDDGCDKCEATAEYFNELEREQNAEQAGGMDASRNALATTPDALSVSGKNEASDSEGISAIHRMPSASRSVLLAEENAGHGDVCAPALCPAPLLLDYPAWRLSFSAYGNLNGWTLP